MARCEVGRRGDFALGRLVTARTDTRVFLRYVNLGLLLIAAVLFAEAL